MDERHVESSTFSGTRWLPFPWMALGLLAMLAAAWAGLYRLGWKIPVLAGNLPAVHGPLMISGFLGTLIGLERAVALRRRWMFTAPALTAFGAVFLVAGGTPAGAPWIMLGSLIVCAMLGVMVRQEPRIHTLTLLAGGVTWFIGNGLWLAGMPVNEVLIWWAGFLILTISGERLELSRVLRLSARQIQGFGIATSLLLLGVILEALGTFWQGRLIGVGLLAMALWLGRHDLARRRLASPQPVTRYIAICLYLGYLWLGIAGLISLRFGLPLAGPVYDAWLHAIFLGFVFSMIFGHAPIIIPGVLQVPFNFRSAFFAPLIILHASLTLRLAGDLTGWFAARQWGGMLNVVALLAFLGLILFTIRATFLNQNMADAELQE